MTTIESVVANDMCVGCGGCEVATDGRIPVQIMPRGYYQADLSSASASDLALGSQVCPFTDESRDEDAIATDHYADLPVDPGAGRFRRAFAGRINSDDELPNSSSGGLTTWIVLELLRVGAVDGVIHVGSGDSSLFEYTVSRSAEDVLAGRKSKYHPATFAQALREVRGDGLRYAFVGIPCAVKGVRLVTEQDPVIREQLKFFVGIVCGHMKSAAYAESFAWQLGVEPSNLETVDFRIKDPELTSRQYSFGAQAADTGEWVEKQTLSLVGGSWGHAVFQLNACNYCDDIFAETADVVVGDAWLAKYEIDWRGTNVVMTRNAYIDELLRDGAARGEFSADELDVDDVVKTQAGNFRHRREGLAVRLADDEAAGRWAPKKRVEPSYEGVSDERIELIRNRRELSERSHPAFARAKAADDLDVYLNEIRPLIENYQQRTKMPFTTRVRNKLKREFWRLLGRVKSRIKNARSRPAINQ